MQMHIMKAVSPKKQHTFAELDSVCITRDTKKGTFPIENVIPIAVVSHSLISGASLRADTTGTVTRDETWSKTLHTALWLTKWPLASDGV
ncbi:unnamed protein product [Ceratitis capitata]|uniref:(Mediterranean fruit fly) hypothetical protein n=1 Tax=Ceratitis capitata TaxID=7213 RepID=A0A811VCT0_CERCA|nr:unnamed protein product [Ceratitis capitata]